MKATKKLVVRILERCQRLENCQAKTVRSVGVNKGEQDNTVNQETGAKILTAMAKAGKLSDKAARFLGARKDKSGYLVARFGGQSSAQARIDNEFPKASDYYYKDYGCTRQEFLDDGAKELEVSIKTRFMTALKRAKKEGVLDSYEAINSILETGADIFAHNDKLANDSVRSWAMLDRAVHGKDLDDLTMKKW